MTQRFFFAVFTIGLVTLLPTSMLYFVAYALGSLVVVVASWPPLVQAGLYAGGALLFAWRAGWNSAVDAEYYQTIERAAATRRGRRK